MKNYTNIKTFQYSAILLKKKTVENDRMTLISTMKELDATKRKALVKACEQVNADFGSIFSTLLPGAQAMLIPPEGKSVTDGLEVRIFFFLPNFGVLKPKSFIFRFRSKWDSTICGKMGSTNCPVGNAPLWLCR